MPDLDHVDDETEHYLAHYFIHIDAQKGACGFTREDSLELIDAAGFNEDSEACKDFLMRAPGHIEERKRMSSCSLNELLLLVDALMASEDTDHLREQKAKSMVTIINQRVPFMPPFNARDSIRRAFGSFTEPLTEALAEVDSSETDMLQQELELLRASHNETQERLRFVIARLDTLLGRDKPDRNEQDNQADYEFFLRSIIHEAISSGVGEAMLGLDYDGKLESLIARLTEEIDMKNMELEAKNEEVLMASQAVLVKAEDMKINAWWSIIPFTFICLMVFLTGASLIWFNNGELATKWQQIIAILAE